MADRKRTSKRLMSVLLMLLTAGFLLILAPKAQAASAEQYRGEYWVKGYYCAVEVKAVSSSKVRIRIYRWWGPYLGNQEASTDATAKVKKGKATFTIHGTERTPYDLKGVIKFQGKRMKLKVSGGASYLNTQGKYLTLTRKYRSNFKKVRGSWKDKIKAAKSLIMW